MHGSQPPSASDEELHSPGAFSPNSQFNLGAVHNSEQLQAPLLQHLSILDLIQKWPLQIILSAAALTLILYAHGLPQALARVLRGPRKHENKAVLKPKNIEEWRKRTPFTILSVHLPVFCLCLPPAPFCPCPLSPPHPPKPSPSNSQQNA